jgi:hypothetical protein
VPSYILNGDQLTDASLFAWHHLFQSASKQQYSVAESQGAESMLSQINDQDREHLRTFPVRRKERIMQKIMTLNPLHSAKGQGSHQFEKALINFHRSGYGLIDMQPQELAFTTVWLRKSSNFSLMGAEVAMLLWEHGNDGGSTTITSWKIRA